MEKTNVAKLLGKSYSYIHKAESGEIENDTTDVINLLLQIKEKKSLMDLFLAEETHLILETAITKCRNSKLIKHAVNLQRFRKLLIDLSERGEDVSELVTDTKLKPIKKSLGS